MWPPNSGADSRILQKRNSKRDDRAPPISSRFSRHHPRLVASPAASATVSRNRRRCVGIVTGPRQHRPATTASPLAAQLGDALIARQFRCSAIDLPVAFQELQKFDPRVFPAAADVEHFEPRFAISATSR